APLLHFTKHAFALHFLLQDTESLINVVAADENLQWISSLCCSERQLPERVRPAPRRLRRFARELDATVRVEAIKHRRLRSGSRGKTAIVTLIHSRLAGAPRVWPRIFALVISRNNVVSALPSNAYRVRNIR